MSTAAPTITCPRCEKKFKGKPELYGKRIKCPGCEKPFVVPSPDAKIDEEQLKNVVDVKEDFEMAAPKEAIQPKPARLFFQDDGPKEYGVTEEDTTPRCPNCANPLESAESVVCLFCGYNTSTRTWGKTKKTIETTGQDRFKWLLPAFICIAFLVSQVIFCLYYCLILPAQLGDGWKWLSHESMKMWFVIISLFDMWPIGMFIYWRLILHPEPPEKEA